MHDGMHAPGADRYSDIDSYIFGKVAQYDDALT